MVGEGGFEPPKQLATDLQSAPFGHSGILPYLIFVKKMELVDGLEPPTCWLQISCSTNWATPAYSCVERLINIPYENTIVNTFFEFFWKIFSGAEKGCFVP